MSILENQKSPRVFISYSWTSLEHENTVLKFAQSLCYDGIDVVLDKWDLKPGHDQYVFMEQMVTSSEINFVLMLFDKKYMEKANAREGGVGIEAQIISSELYGKAQQDKFIPVVMEFDEFGNPCLPRYAKNQIFIDLSGSDSYSGNYEQLLRRLWNQPLFRKPNIGIAPAHIFTPNKQFFSTRRELEMIDLAIENGNIKRLQTLSRKFFSDFLEELKGYRIAKHLHLEPEVAFDEIIFQSIQSMLPLRDEYILYLEKMVEVIDENDLGPITEFFEQIHRFIDFDPENGIDRAQTYDFDNFKFIIRELLLYTVVICIKNEKFKFLYDFLNTDFFLFDFRTGKLQPDKYSVFDSSLRGIDEARSNRLNLNLISLAAHLIIERSTKKYTKTDLAGADVLLAFLGRTTFNEFWYPKCHAYLDNNFPFLEKLRSLRHFNKVKILFGVSTPQELVQKAQKITHETFRQGRGMLRNPLTFERFVPLNEIATLV